MNIQQIINEKLSENLNKFGRLVAFDREGRRMTFYGYIREVKENYIKLEHNDGPGLFRFNYPVYFQRIKREKHYENRSNDSETKK